MKKEYVTPTMVGERFSADGAGTYHHTGRLVITNIDNNRPNHS